MPNTKSFSIQNLNIFLISILPVGLVFGSLISNSIVCLICIFFIYDLYVKRNFHYLKQYNFYFLLIINIYLILNSFFLSEYNESIIKSVGFLRFIILTYAISYYFIISANKILKIWLLFFIIVSFDILFEYTLGDKEYVIMKRSMKRNIFLQILLLSVSALNTLRKDKKWNCLCL